MGFSDLPSPSASIMGYSIGKRAVYITDEVYNPVRNAATEDLRNAMDLAYLTGRRPSDAWRMTEDDIVSGFLIVNQGKTHKSCVSSLRVNLQRYRVALRHARRSIGSSTATC
jgi:integrase